MLTTGHGHADWPWACWRLAMGMLTRGIGRPGWLRQVREAVDAERARMEAQLAAAVAAEAAASEKRVAEARGRGSKTHHHHS